MPAKYSYGHAPGASALAYPVRYSGLIKQDNTDVFYYRNDEMEDLRCMSYTSKGASEILVAGLQDKMFTIDVDKGTITKQVERSHKLGKNWTKVIDTHERSLYHHEAQSIYMCSHERGVSQYSRFNNLQPYQDMECPFLPNQ